MIDARTGEPAPAQGFKPRGLGYTRRSRLMGKPSGEARPDNDSIEMLPHQALARGGIESYSVTPILVPYFTLSQEKFRYEDVDKLTALIGTHLHGSRA